NLHVSYRTFCSELLQKDRSLIRVHPKLKLQCCPPNNLIAFPTCIGLKSIIDFHKSVIDEAGQRERKRTPPESLRELFFGFFQFRLYLSSLRPLPEKREDRHGLRQEHEQRGYDVPFVCFPERGLPIQHNAAGRELALLYPPPFQSTPIEHVGVIAHHDRNVLWPFAVENLHSHISCNTSVVCPMHEGAAHSSRPKIHIVHDKNRCIRSTGY